MKILIIGLGIYGSNLARDLSAMGNEVIGADSSDTAVDQVKDFVSTVYRLDTTDETQMGVLPLKSVDVVIVAIGENFGASVRTVAILKQLGVPHIYARAIDPLHRSILECFDIDRILTPEQHAASDLTMEMLMGSKVETLSVDTERVIVKFTAPAYFVDEPYSDLKTLNQLGIRLLAVSRPVDHTNVLGVKVKQTRAIDFSDAALRVEKGDVLTCLGTRKSFRDLMKHSSSL